MRHHSAFSLLIIAGISMLASAPVRASEAPAYEAYAVRFATARDCPLAYLVKGADPARKIDLAMTLLGAERPRRSDSPGRCGLLSAGVSQGLRRHRFHAAG